MIYQVWALNREGQDVVYFSGTYDDCEAFISAGGVPSDIDTDIEVLPHE